MLITDYSLLIHICNMRRADLLACLASHLPLSGKDQALQTVTGARLEDFQPLYECTTSDMRPLFCSKPPRRGVSSQQPPAVFISLFFEKQTSALNAFG